MMPRPISRAARCAFAVALLAPAGCGNGSAKPPTFSHDYGYGPGGIELAGQFRDDAPANRRVAPDQFPLRFVDHEGKPVDLTAYRGKSNVVLVVSRGIPQSPGGVFCPFCLAQTASLMANAAEFQKRDGTVLVVYPGPSDRVAEFIDQAKGQAAGVTAAPFPVLLDRDCAACDTLGIRDDLAKPSVYVLDKRGNVVYAYVGETMTDRPSVKALLAQLDKLTAGK
jgi:peroxiredoxin